MDSREAAARVATPHDDDVKRTSPDEPAVAVAVAPVPLRDVLGSARFGGSVLDPRASDSEDGGAVLGDEDDDLAGEPLSGDEDEELYDTDDSDTDTDFEFEEDDDPLELRDSDDATGSTDLTLAPVEFLGAPARFASVDSTAGFMVLRAGGDAAEASGGEITVHYSYVRFTRAQSGDPGVDVYSGAKLHPVRFLVSAHAAADDDDAASSLRLAGAALADMVYPRRFSAQLRALWSSLVTAAPAHVDQPRAAGLDVAVSVGILRRGDRTPERMASMRAALAAAAAPEAEGPRVWPFLRDVGVEMHLPVPVRADESEGDDSARPAKRRRFASVEKECAICYETLERGLAAWPRCSHVFHGECLEQLLVRGDQRCPLCRSELSGKSPG